jgi:hypothetical protein
MTYYKLRKDTPTAKAGTKFKADVRGYDNRGLLARLVPLDTSVDLQWKVRDIDNFDEWFEKIQEPTDSIHWKPQPEDEYWHIDYWGRVDCTNWGDTTIDVCNFDRGNIYRTEEECSKARRRKLAKARLRRTSTFTPDFENGRGGWFVAYNHLEAKLEYFQCSWQDAGESVRYETREDAEKSIKENREDWLIYFGVEDGRNK